MEEKKNYKSTLNLPQTAFAMEAKLTANEPARLKRWNESKLYEKLMARPAPLGKWVLHDGPPFANGDIHIGHLINKTLKDVILRFRSMQGFQTPYVPGWDCHGLPIEHKIQEQIKKEGKNIRELSTLEVRKQCHEYAAKYVEVQREQFKRLGILGEWENPYETMKPGYEAATLDVFAKFVDAGLVYKKLKPVPWSIENQTALADAELEYKDVEDDSVFVEFPFADQEQLLKTFGVKVGPVRLLVWTTTPWTLPANLAIAVHPDVEYEFVTVTLDEPRTLVVAKNLHEKVFRRPMFGEPPVYKERVVGRVLGQHLAGVRYRHPFIQREGKVVLANYVTITDGTGLVHTAPGHGEDDYKTAVREGLDVYSPVLATGRFDDTVPPWLQGKTIWEANKIIVERLKSDRLLFAEEKITHSYPHDWRSKKPVIFRATEQWFIDVKTPFTTGNEEKSPLWQRAIMSLINDRIGLIPVWGQVRLSAMLASRPDWCISRQRAWGLPIPIFYNQEGKALYTPESIRAVAKVFAEKGSDAWFTCTPVELLGDHDPGPDFPKDKLQKEKDIFDVWFESGSSWHAVLQARPNLNFPADLYLEGSDQHRGWFQLSLLASLGATGKPPFKQVLTHGFVVKPDGTKVSKSDKEYVTAMQEIDRHGADLLRLWCCSVDYQNDIPASPAAIREFGDKYRKIRNTLRYLLSNLYDFDPATDSRPIEAASLDGWAMAEVNKLIGEVTAAYDAYQLHRAFRLLHDFCAVQISAVYGNAMKDRLYCEKADSPPRRRCQTVMRRMADCLIRLLAPMLAFTADEAWEHLPHKSGEEAALAAVHLLLLPKESGELPTDEQKREWAKLMELRDQALFQLDALKKSVGLNKALDAEVVYHVGEALRRRLEQYGPDLEDLVGAGFHSFADGPAGADCVEIVDRREKYKACARSWKRRPDVGRDAEYPDLSLRDAAVVRAAESK
ncbi:MAG: isoleucine--tRNA ligase [Tepidisphaeraceae bacterium]|jgi:isoleucyl-tRNA synthetase